MSSWFELTAQAAASSSTEVATEAVGATVAATDSSKELILDFLPEKPIPIDPTEVLGIFLFSVDAPIFPLPF